MINKLADFVLNLRSCCEVLVYFESGGKQCAMAVRRYVGASLWNSINGSRMRSSK